MSTIANWLGKILLVGVMAGVGLAFYPVTNGAALQPADLAMPPALAQISSDRLERLWEREQRIYDRLGVFFDHADQRISDAQELIDKAKRNGKDVSSLQNALDALAAAVKDARPIYESGKGILAAHQGFDANGKVTDYGKAVETLRDLRDKLREIRRIVLEPARQLREAIRAFRQANRPAQTPTP